MSRLPQPEAPTEHSLAEYLPGLHRYLLRRLRGAVDAEDLAQVVYLRFLQAPNLERIREPQAYLYRIAVNAVSEYLLRRKSERVTYDSVVAEQRSGELKTEDASEEVEAEQLFRRVVQELPSTHRAVLVLYAQEGLSLEHISARLGLNEPTVRKYLRHALARFRAADWNRS